MMAELYTEISNMRVLCEGRVYEKERSRLDLDTTIYIIEREISRLI